jgi:hypothetical protein
MFDNNRELYEALKNFFNIDTLALCLRRAKPFL